MIVLVEQGEIDSLELSFSRGLYTVTFRYVKPTHEFISVRHHIFLGKNSLRLLAVQIPEAPLAEQQVHTKCMFHYLLNSTEDKAALANYTMCKSLLLENMGLLSEVWHDQYS